MIYLSAKPDVKRETDRGVHHLTAKRDSGVEMERGLKGNLRYFGHCWDRDSVSEAQKNGILAI